ncbi:MAG TPA: homoserine O-acetyltransferase [Cyclobacteriaceae bacterium]
MERNKQSHIFHHLKKFKLEQGNYLNGFQLQYHTYGNLNENKDNVIWICHALSGGSDVDLWWPKLIGDDTLFETKNYFIICANVLGSCYGSTGPLSINPGTGKPYFHDFPAITIRDMVNALILLKDHLKINYIDTLVGGSLGGQQVLEWAIMEPDTVQKIIPVAANAFHSPWGIAFNESQRMCIAADQTWSDDDPHAGKNGLKAARAAALLSYRNYKVYLDKQLDDPEKTDAYRASSYQQYQGNKFIDRFNAFSYWSLSKAMDSHNVGRRRGSMENALRKIKAKTLAIGVDTDILFPTNEQKFLAHHIPHSVYREVRTNYGHDGFLVEIDQLKKFVSAFMQHHLMEC